MEAKIPQNKTAKDKTVPRKPVPRKPVLVVRPLRDQDAFLRLMDQAQINYQYQPIMRIEPVAETEPEAQLIKTAITQFSDFDHAIFISANAAELGVRWLDEYWPMLPVGIEIFAVGQQTAQILSAYGLEVSSPQRQPNTEGLLQEMEQLQDLQNKSVIIFRGGGGRTTLGETLESRGASVTYCELYRRMIEPDSLVEAQRLLEQSCCLVVHSGELIQAMGPARAGNIDLQLVVPSDRVAEVSRKLGYSNIQVAANALPESMLQAVQIALGS